jgi:tetratricopeptide (TPR) repeat protein
MVMNRLSYFAAALVLASIAGPTSRAGIYGGSKPVPGPTVEAGGVKPLSFGQFRLYFTQYTVDLIKPTSEVYKGFVAERDRLRTLSKRAPLKTSEALDLSVALIRLRAYEEAIAVLTPLVLRERNNFMLLGNLASAYQASGQYNRAAEYLQQSQDSWPRQWPGLSKEQLDWYHELEKYQLRLVKKRYRESLKRPAAQGSERRPSSMADSVDDLFDNAQGPLQFKAEDGTYQAGTLAETERKKLPAHALAIVQQFVLWFPDDTRLYWQLGELYNADKDVAAAATILHECIWTRRYDVPLLQEHRKIVEAGVPKQSGPVLEDMTFKTEPKPPADPGAWLPERRQIYLVGGVAGTIALALLYLQIREFRQRRRQPRK